MKIYWKKEEKRDGGHPSFQFHRAVVSAHGVDSGGHSGGDACHQARHKRLDCDACENGDRKAEQEHQSVFNCACAGFVGNEMSDHGFHGGTPRRLNEKVLRAETTSTNYRD